ncbi:hypothetical protein ACHAXS_009562 [Conticribra weissflogii]
MLFPPNAPPTLFVAIKDDGTSSKRIHFGKVDANSESNPNISVSMRRLSEVTSEEKLEPSVVVIIFMRI